MNFNKKRSLKNLLKYFSVKKYINFLKKYPRLQNLLKIKSKNLRLLLINFYLFFVKKNKNLKFFFFDKNEQIDEIYFNLRDLDDKTEKIFQSLAYNGIVIIENIISETERKKILEYFNEIEGRELVSEWINSEVIDASSIKYKDKEKKVLISCMHKDLSLLGELNNINNTLTKKIFGKPINTVGEFFIHNCINKEEKNTYDDTNFHIDRYLPCLKIIYSPEEINISDAPFGFIKTTHKLNNSFMRQFLLNTKNFIIKNDELTSDIKEKIVEVICPSNSLIVTFTNGFHKRNIFNEEKNIRKTVFFQFTKNFNNFSLINYKNFN